VTKKKSARHTHKEPRTSEVRPDRFTRFLVRYPNGGAVIESWVERPGAPIRQIQLEHPLARVSAVPESKYTGKND
jgi:hypothetical protein